MKSNGETEVEFTPSSWSTTSTYIAADCEAANDAKAATNPMLCGDTVLVTGVDEELMLYRSKCPIDDMPDVARGMAWHDPFYEDGTDHCIATEIIAVFDIDRTLYDRSTNDIFKFFYFVPVYCICLLPVLFLSGTSGTFFIAYCAVGIYYLIGYLVVDCYCRMMKLRIKCMHIAISTNGIYIDEVDAPESCNLACRNRIPYYEIKECRIVSSYNPVCQKMYYKLRVMTTRSDVEVAIEGISNQRKFVEIVNVMMERERHTQCLKCSAVDTIVIEPKGENGCHRLL